MPDIKTDVLPWLPHGLFDNQNSHRKSKGEFMNVGNIFDVSMHGMLEWLWWRKNSLNDAFNEFSFSDRDITYRRAAYGKQAF